MSGTLFLLTSTAPWTPPELAVEPSRYSPPAEATPVASDQAELSPAFDEADRTYTAATDKEPDEPRNIEADPSKGVETFAALGTPLNAESADAGEEVGGDLAVTGAQQAAEDGPAAGEASSEVSADVAAEAPSPNANDRSEAATAEFAQMMTTLPPRVITSERSEAATDQIAEVLAALPPAPPPPLNVKAAVLTSETAAAPSASDAIEISGLKVAALTGVNPAGAPLVEVAAVVAPPPPLPRRRPEIPQAPTVAAQPAPEAPPVPKLVAQPESEAPPAPKVAAQPAPETSPAPKIAARPAPQQQTARPRGLFPNWKPMALAPADQPAPAASRPATARPSSGAYASQVWSRLARHKPRAGQHGSASVAFAIGANGALGVARIARSSGNARIDQLALATVRNAAPFPPPPSGAVSYTIRIDF